MFDLLHYVTITKIFVMVLHMDKKTDLLSNHQTKQIEYQVICSFRHHDIVTGMGITRQLQLTGFSPVESKQRGLIHSLTLSLCEKRDYRNNLKQRPPRLYVVINQADDAGTPDIELITASPSLAKRYRDLNFLVLSNDMPPWVVDWISQFTSQN